MKADWVPDILRALRFHDADADGLRALADRNWRTLLERTDAAYLTVPLALRCASLFPAEARVALESTMERSAQCHGTLVANYSEIAELFQRSGIDFLVLKGVTQWPGYVDRPAHRMQTDIDLYCASASLEPARSALEELGYGFVGSRAKTATDHLPVMIRRTGWTWRGDYYDAGRPPSVELHFRFWDRETEAFPAGDGEGFWRRRVWRDIDGLSVPTLHLRDGVTYSAMHIVRHLLRGDLQIRHVYELAHFLEQSAADDEFWQARTNDGPVEGMAFRLAREWFRCDLHRTPVQAIQELPERVGHWFDLFGLSPARNLSHPNKDELWLHLCLAQDAAARRSIVLRRLFPIRRQRVVLDAHTPAAQAGFLLTLRRAAFRISFMAKRLLHHLRTLPPVFRSALRWWRADAAAS